MVIITEKTISDPNHSISREDIQTVINNIPKDWLGPAHKFKLSSQLFSKSKWDRPVILNNTTFVIMSRGLERTHILKEFLIELSIHPSGLGYSINGHHINKTLRKKIEDYIQPYWVAILKELNS
jgi:hypothetical protein